MSVFFVLVFYFFRFFTKVDIDSVKLYNSALFYRVFVSFHFVTFKNFENSNRKFELSSFLKWRNDQSLIRVCRVCDVFLLLVLVLVTFGFRWQNFLESVSASVADFRFRISVSVAKIF